MELIIMAVLAFASVIASTIGFIVYKREANEVKREEIAVLEAKKAMEDFLNAELLALKARVRALEEKSN